MKLAAFTLFESVIATSLVAVLIGVGTMIYSNVLASEKPLAYHQAKAEIDKLFFELKEAKAFFNRTYDFEGHDIIQEIKPYRGNKNLLQVSYIIQSGENQWWTEKHLIVAENFEN